MACRRKSVFKEDLIKFIDICDSCPYAERTYTFYVYIFT